MERILVTPRSLSADPPAELGLLTDAGFELVFPTPGKLPSEAELIELVPGCVGWLAGVEPVSIDVIKAADHLRAVSRNGVGVDNLPLAELERRGIRVLRAEGANSVGVAELAVGLMLSALRSIPAVDTGIKSGEWPRLRGMEISGRTVGLIGCGAIGRHVAQIVSAMGANVVAYDPFRPAFDLHGPFEWLDIDQVFERADILSLHCPPPPDGSAIADARRIGLMKSQSVLINTARFSLVDEEAARAALDEGRMSALATDVFSEEPPPPNSLARHPRVVATSHIGGFTEESISKATRIAVVKLLEALDIKPRQ